MSRFIEQLRNVPGLINIQITPDHLTDRTIHAGEIELSFLNISFDIDLSAGPHSVRNENKFKFVSRSFYHSVGTLIFPQFNTEDPSDGVFRVREYLKSYLKEPYCLNVIGPSPFHADFFIRRTNFFGVEIEKLRGYDTIKVYVSATENKEIIDQIFNELEDELDLFYLIRQSEHSQFEEWDDVSEKVSEAIKQIDFFSYKPADQFTLLRPKRLIVAMQALSEFEAKTLTLPAFLNERLRGILDLGKDNLLSYAKKDIENFYTFPIESSQNLLKFVSEIRGKTAATTTSYITMLLNVLLTTGIAIALYQLGIKP